MQSLLLCTPPQHQESGGRVQVPSENVPIPARSGCVTRPAEIAGIQEHRRLSSFSHRHRRYSSSLYVRVSCPIRLIPSLRPAIVPDRSGWAGDVFRVLLQAYRLRDPGAIADPDASYRCCCKRISQDRWGWHDISIATVGDLRHLFTLYGPCTPYSVIRSPNPCCCSC